MNWFTLPTKVDMGVYKRDTKKNKIGDKKKGFIINLNNWRNANPFFRTAADKNFREYVKKHINIGNYTKLAIVYSLYVKGKRSKDVMNVISIFDKYFSDTLTELGCISDDDYKVLPLVVGLFGGYSETNEEYVKVSLIDLGDEQVFNNIDKYIGKVIKDEIYKGGTSG